MIDFDSVSVRKSTPFLTKKPFVPTPTRSIAAMTGHRHQRFRTSWPHTGYAAPPRLAAPEPLQLTISGPEHLLLHLSRSRALDSATRQMQRLQSIVNTAIASCDNEEATFQPLSLYFGGILRDPTHGPGKHNQAELRSANRFVRWWK